MPLTEWIALVAAVGVGSIVAAIVGWWSAKAVTISNHRQAWINTLRDDLATFLKQVDVLHFRQTRISGAHNPNPTTDDLEKQQDARNDAMLVYRRVLMRLNMTETDHEDLAEALNALMTVSKTTADADKIDAVVGMARVVLKHEWAVTKYGIFTKLVLLLRRKPVAIQRPPSSLEQGRSPS